MPVCVPSDLENTLLTGHAPLFRCGFLRFWLIVSFVLFQEMLLHGETISHEQSLGKDHQYGPV